MISPFEYSRLTPDERAQHPIVPWPEFTIYPARPWMLVNFATGERLRLGVPLGQMPPRFDSPELAMRAAEKWLERQP